MLSVLLVAPACLTAQEAATGVRPLSFVSDVLPILSKAGCNSSGCHSSPEGQNGFRLSVFSYDPKSDFEEIVKQGHGRRVSPASPELSLFLLKPTQELPHEGGERIEKGSPSYQTLKRWIAQGMIYQLPDEPALAGIELAEPQRSAARGELGQLRVSAKFSDGSTRDVTALADFKSSEAGFVEVDESGRFSVKDKTGEGIVVVRYMGEVAISKISVAPERLLPAEEYAQLPRANLIDEQAIARWAQLGLAHPSCAMTASSSVAPPWT